MKLRKNLSASKDFFNESNDIQDYNGHGTHIAGVIASEHLPDKSLKGINPNVELLILKTFSMYGFSSTASIVKAIDFAIKNEVRIINASYGSSFFDQTAFEAYKEAEKNGILVVAAAGNNSEDTEKKPYYPSGYNLTNIISVGASNSEDQPAWFSNFGNQTVHVIAPGEHIFSSVVTKKFENPQEVFSLNADSIVESDWEKQSCYDENENFNSWRISPCGDISGNCLNYSTPSHFSPSKDYHCFKYFLKKPIESDRQKRFVMKATTSISQVKNGNKYTAMSFIAGSRYFMMQANFLNQTQKDWIDSDADLSKPGFFYAGTTAWENFHIGFNFGLMNFQNSTEHKDTFFKVKKISIFKEDVKAVSGSEFYSGTSMAAPHVVGIASAIISINPKLKPNQVKERIMKTCDLKSALSQRAACGGRVNFFSAINGVEKL